MKKFLALIAVGLAGLSATAQRVDQSIIPYRSGAKWGFAGVDRNITIQPKYDEVGWFSEGFAPVRIGTKWGYINTAGKLVIPARYTVAKNFRKGYTPTKSGSDTVLFAGVSTRPDKYEICIGTTGKIMPKCPAVAENAVVENRVPVKTVVSQKNYNIPGGEGMFDKIVDDYNTSSNENYYIAVKGGKYGVINKQFQNVVAFEYDKIEVLRDNKNQYLQTLRRDLTGILSLDGKTLIQPENTSIKIFNSAKNNNDYAVLQRGNNFYVMNIADGTVAAEGYNNITFDNHGFVMTNGSNQQGYYFLNGKSIAPKYRKVEYVSDDFLRVTTSNGKVGYINTAGDEYFKD